MTVGWTMGGDSGWWRRWPIYGAMVWSVLVHGVVVLGLSVKGDETRERDFLPPMRVEYLGRDGWLSSPDRQAVVGKREEAPEEARLVPVSGEQGQEAQRVDHGEGEVTVVEAVPVPALEPQPKLSGRVTPEGEVVQRAPPVARAKPVVLPRAGGVTPLKLASSLGEVAEMDRLARRHQERLAVEQGEATVDLNTRESRFAAYFQQIRRRVEEVWRYPAEAKQGGLSGSLLMEFTIDRGGRLTGVTIRRSSGQVVLDEAALEAVRTAGPFPSLPAEWGLQKLHVKTNFEYIMRKAGRGG